MTEIGTTVGATTGAPGIRTGARTTIPVSQVSGSQTETTVVTTVVRTNDQETENKTGCPVSLPPPAVCLGPLGEQKCPGDVWTANCHRCTCTDARTVNCQPKKCPSLPTCQTGEKLVKFKSNDTCCEVGYCEPRTCLFNNTNYKIGASFDDPTNPCISYYCNNTGFAVVVQDCPKQTWCAEEDRIYDSKKCCYTCKNHCRASNVNVTVTYKGCKKRTEMARCIGECKKTVKYNYDTFQLENPCVCCKEDNYEFREIDLDCPDGTTISYRYMHTLTCSCSNTCQESVTKPPLNVTSLVVNSDHAFIL
ncbi:submaxillary mucin-like protein [Choloepus didactylus]|uniref:submaxillary mucin-like protein n=1 Tax=Choloepus didactylus TaxID=27675 RepID=UPI00189DDDDB|nr:submaxillary mucin-like protein [Choloepus didactylus]